MRKFLVILTLLLVSQWSTSQDSLIPKEEFYMSIKSFRQQVTDTMNLEYINYIIRDGDTLIPYRRTVNETDELIKAKYILKDTTFLNIYKSIAFRSNKTNDPKHRFWKDEIKLFFGKSVPRKHQRFLMRFIKRNLNDIENLNITKTKKLEDSNFIIYYDGDFEYENKFENDYTSRVLYQINWNNNRINKSRIKLYPEFFNKEEQLLGELARTFINNLGYFYESSQLGCDSMFSDCTQPVERLSKIDKEILKYHYSYGFCVGMSLESFEEQDNMAREFYRLNPGSDYFILFRRDDFVEN
jgi:hypothetical protein